MAENSNRYFQAKKDTSLPRAFRAVRDNSGTVYDYETEGVSYYATQVFSASQVDPRVVQRFDDGDDHLNSLLKEVSKSDFEDFNEEQRLAGQLVRAPEHSVEAYALARDEDQPYKLLSEEEKLELLSAGAEEAKKAQEEAREANEDKVSSEADTREAIDFAADKGNLDREAEKTLPVSEVADSTPETTPAKATKGKKASTEPSGEVKAEAKAQGK